MMRNIMKGLGPIIVVVSVMALLTGCSLFRGAETIDHDPPGQDPDPPGYVPTPYFDWDAGQAPNGWELGGWAVWGAGELGTSLFFVEDPDSPDANILVIDPQDTDDRYGIYSVFTPVEEGMRYILWADARTEGRRAYLYIEFLDAEGQVIDDPRYKTRSTLSSEWETIYQSLVAPDHAAYVYLRVYVNRFDDGDSEGKTYFRNVKLEVRSS